LVVIKRRAHAVDLCRAEPNFSRYGRPTRRSIGCIAGNRARLVIIEAEHLGDLNKHAGRLCIAAVTTDSWVTWSKRASVVA
jgi:hypothetical protein